MDLTKAKSVLEAVLLCAPSPVSLSEINRLFADQISSADIAFLLDQLRADWLNRGVALVEVASGWRFQSTSLVAEYLGRLDDVKPPKYSRAVQETLAIIAYRQPVTRGDIEEVRGVTASSQILRQIEERGWVEVIGHRETPGRPALYATTAQFLNDFGLTGLRDLPSLNTVSAQPPALLFESL